MAGRKMELKTKTKRKVLAKQIAETLNARAAFEFEEKPVVFPPPFVAPDGYEQLEGTTFTIRVNPDFISGDESTHAIIITNEHGQEFYLKDAVSPNPLRFQCEAGGYERYGCGYSKSRGSVRMKVEGPVYAK